MEAIVIAFIKNAFLKVLR